jgi:hypothetical protein
MILTSIGIIILIFLMNIIPAFMPPTWILLSFVGFSFHLNNYSLVILSIFAAIASTSGRVVLAMISDKMIRNKILSDRARNNIDTLKIEIEKRKALTFGFFLSYAFSPFPSGQLFLAYGLTDLKIRIAAIPFFLGRLVSYTFWALAASKVSQMVDITSLKSGAYFGSFFILAQIAAFYLVYLFIKLDWKILFNDHKFRFVKKIIE